MALCATLTGSVGIHHFDDIIVINFLYATNKLDNYKDGNEKFSVVMSGNMFVKTYSEYFGNGIFPSKWIMIPNIISGEIYSITSISSVGT